MNLLGASYPLVRPLLFALDAERAHQLTLKALATAPSLAARLCGRRRPAPHLARSLGPLQLAGPVGLAAGLDKEGVAIPFWPALGFGFIEVGTVTAHPQPGNPRPRLFRLPAERALINRMGFNNFGSEALAKRLRGLREAGNWPGVPVGVNIGKSKVTPLDDAVSDYVLSTQRLAGVADYFTVNVSSPNTPGLRSLQDRDTLSRLLPAVLEAAGGVPVLLKLSPDLADEAITEAIELSISVGITGVIATNTTLRHDLLHDNPNEQGGMSGRPLWAFARSRIQIALDAAAGNLPIVGVGGIHCADQVRELLNAGCTAVQVYTAFIYQGPGLPSRLHQGLR